MAHVARNVKRRFLRQNRLRASDLDGIALALLDGWARTISKVRLMDEYAAEHGWLDADGKPPAFSDSYFTALNTASRYLARLETHLCASDDPPPLSLLVGEGRRIREAAGRETPALPARAGACAVEPAEEGS